MIELRAFAKINLGLEVLGRRPDGYHSLHTVFQTIDLHDTLHVAENSDGVLRLKGDDPAVPWNEENTIHRAWRLLRGRLANGGGFDVFVRKRIPAGAGLAGGSSDAGAFILFLNRYHGLNLSRHEMTGLAAGVGADVPFFIIGGTALGEGKGDELTPLPDMARQRLLLFIPDMAVSTRLVFSRLVLTKGRFASKIDVFLRNRDFSILENQLEKTAIELFPRIGEIKEKMIAGGCTFVQMSGSGSALFGVAPAGKIPALKKALPGIRLQRTIGQKYYQENVLGCSQAVRHRSLEPRLGGSNPPTPDQPE